MSRKSFVPGSGSETFCEDPCPGFCGVRSSPFTILGWFLSLKNNFLSKQICWRLHATEPTLPVRDLVGLGHCRVVGVQCYPVAMFSWDLIVATARFPSQVVTNFSTFLAFWRSTRLWFTEVFRCFNHVESMFSGFLPCAMNCISEATWHSLKFPRDQSTKIRHVSLQMESMKLKRAEQGSAGKQRRSDISDIRIPRDCN